MKKIFLYRLGQKKINTRMREKGQRINESMGQVDLRTLISNFENNKNDS